MIRHNRFTVTCMNTIVTLAVLLGGIGVGHAAKEDWKVFPGTMCVSNSPDIDVRGNGRILNMSKGTLNTVYCPLVREFLGTNDGWREVAVKYVNSNPRNNVTCTMWEHDRWGKRKTKRDATGTTKPYGTIKFGNRIGAGTGTIFTLSCVLPPMPGGNKVGGGIELILVKEAN